MDELPEIQKMLTDEIELYESLIASTIGKP